MSGGPYGRGKAPERTCLKLPFWPQPDRDIWQQACECADILEIDAGVRANHATLSNYKAEQGYGRWLTFLKFNDVSALTLAPADRITSQRVISYVECLEGLGNSTQTVLSRLQELGEAAKVFDPDRDWSFINRLASKVRARHKPARSKTHLRLSDELIELGTSLIARAKNKDGLEAAILHRDGLLIALTAYAPSRWKPFLAGASISRRAATPRSMPGLFSIGRCKATAQK